MVRMVVTDLDGTLFNSTNQISEENLKAIHRIQDSGLTFAIASGRSYDLAFRPLREYGINCDAILGNGSQYVDEKGNVIFSCYLKKEPFVRIIDIMASEGLSHIIYTSDRYYTDQDPYTVRKTFVDRGIAMMGRKEEEFAPGGKYDYMPCNHLIKIDDPVEFAQCHDDILKVEAFAITPDKVAPVRDKLCQIPHIAYLSSFNNNIEVTDENAQKGLILEKVAEIKGLSKDEIMVMGDGMNDISLFTCFRAHSYAPANACPEILSIAHGVVAENTENGFAEAVNKVLDEQGTP